MKVLKCTTWDGREFFTNNPDLSLLSSFWGRVKQQQLNQLKSSHAKARVDLVNMTPENYSAISEQQIIKAT